MTLATHYEVIDFDGNALSTDAGGQHRLMFWLTRGMWDSPNVRGGDSVIPSAAGRTPRNRVRDYLTIELFGIVAGTGANDTAQRADVLAALQTVQGILDNTLAPAVLRVLMEDGTTIGSITARPVNLIEVTPVIDPTYRQLSAELVAVGSSGWSFA